MVSVPASVVTISLTIAGDLASFGPAQEASLKTSLRKELSCEEPACFLSVRLKAGSINVETSLTIPQAAAAAAAPGAGPTTTNPSATIAAVQAAAKSFVMSPTAAISSALGVSVTAADPAITFQPDVIVPLAVAPPPPSPPPPPAASSPLPPQDTPLAATETPPPAFPITMLEVTQTSSAQKAKTSTAIEMHAIWIGVALVLVVAVVGAGYCWWRRAQRERKRVQSTARAAPVVDGVSHSIGSFDDDKEETASEGYCPDLSPVDSSLFVVSSTGDGDESRVALENWNRSIATSAIVTFNELQLMNRLSVGRVQSLRDFGGEEERQESAAANALMRARSRARAVEMANVATSNASSGSRTDVPSISTISFHPSGAASSRTMRQSVSEGGLPTLDRVQVEEAARRRLGSQHSTVHIALDLTPSRAYI